MEASRVFQGSFREISKVFQVRLKGVSSNFKVVSRVFEISLKGGVSEVSMALQCCFKGVSRKCPRSFNEVSRVFQ